MNEIKKRIDGLNLCVLALHELVMKYCRKIVDGYFVPDADHYVAAEVLVILGLYSSPDGQRFKLNQDQIDFIKQGGDQ